MLWTVSVMLISVAWLRGVVSSYTLGGFIHVLLLLAIATVLIDVIGAAGRSDDPWRGPAWPRRGYPRRRMIISYVGDGAPTTRALRGEILASEEEHAENPWRHAAPGAQARASRGSLPASGG